MKRIFFLAFLGCSSLLTLAQETPKKDPSSTTDLKVVPVAGTKTAVTTQDKNIEETLILKEDVYDFGKIPQGKPVTHIFEVSNIGKTELKISNVQASCGCTTPEWDQDKPIPAGGNTKITVGYNAAAEGVFTKLVTITYGEMMNKQITIKGEVWKTPASSAPVNAGLNDLKN